MKNGPPPRFVQILVPPVRDLGTAENVVPNPSFELWSDSAIGTADGWKSFGRLFAVERSLLGAKGSYSQALRTEGPDSSARLFSEIPNPHKLRGKRCYFSCELRSASDSDSFQVSFGLWTRSRLEGDSIPMFPITVDGEWKTHAVENQMEFSNAGIEWARVALALDGGPHTLMIDDIQVLIPISQR